MLNRCRIVLVRPHYPGNLGATARVMRNFGLTDLVLVDPVASVNDLEARRMATHGLSVLDAARVVPELGDAAFQRGYIHVAQPADNGRLARHAPGCCAGWT